MSCMMAGNDVALHSYGVLCFLWKDVELTLGVYLLCIACQSVIGSFK